jgi:hypothetical protein
VTALAAAAVLAAGSRAGSRVAGGSDSSGYLSEAKLWQIGRLRVEEPAIRRARWPRPEWTFAPICFIPGTGAKDLVPFYPPGYPLALAAAEIVGRSPSAKFLVVPLLAALTVCLTFVAGRHFASPGGAAWAALLVAASPPFLFQTLQPMSDVPATAWWLAATTLLLVPGDRARAARAFAGGLAASAGLLTRPNTAPLAIVGAAWLALEACSRRDTDSRAGRPVRLVLPVLAFCMGVVPGAALLAWFNATLYGSPFRLGYTVIGLSLSLANIPANIRLYTGALLETHGVMVVAGTASITVSAVVAGLDGLSRRARRPAATHVLYAAAFVGVILFTYLLLTPMDSWTYLRFLLPAAPLVMVFAVRALESIPGLAAGGRARAVLHVVMALLVADSAFAVVRLGVFDLRGGEARYAAVARYLKADLRHDTVVVGMQHTGSVWYYTGMTTLRWELLDEDWLDRAVREFQAAGRRTVFVLESWEETRFRERFKGQEFGALDWPPHARFDASVPVTVYDPADRAEFLRGLGRGTSVFTIR